MGPSPGLRRSVGPGGGVEVGRKAAAEPGPLMLERVKRSRPAEPAYCKDATVLWKISRSTARLQKWIIGACRFLEMPRTRRLGASAVPVAAPNGPKLLVLSGIVGVPSVPTGTPATNVGTAKSNLFWKNGET